MFLKNKTYRRACLLFCLIFLHLQSWAFSDLDLLDHNGFTTNPLKSPLTAALGFVSAEYRSEDEAWVHRPGLLGDMEIKAKDVQQGLQDILARGNEATVTQTVDDRTHSGIAIPLGNPVSMAKTIAKGAGVAAAGDGKV